jgi:hypothetical protein
MAWDFYLAVRKISHHEHNRPFVPFRPSGGGPGPINRRATARKVSTNARSIDSQNDTFQRWLEKRATAFGEQWGCGEVISTMHHQDTRFQESLDMMRWRFTGWLGGSGARFTEDSWKGAIMGKRGCWIHQKATRTTSDVRRQKAWLCWNLDGLLPVSGIGTSETRAERSRSLCTIV